MKTQRLVHGATLCASRGSSSRPLCQQPCLPVGSLVVCLLQIVQVLVVGRPTDGASACVVIICDHNRWVSKSADTAAGWPLPLQPLPRWRVGPLVYAVAWACLESQQGRHGVLGAARQ